MLSNLKILDILRRRVQLSTSQIVARQPAALVHPAHSFLVSKYFQTSIDGRLSEKSFKMESQVHHDAKKNIFSLKPGGGAESAVLVYDWVEEGVIDFHHTEVPVAFRGQGVAKVLAKAGLDFAVRENLKVVLSCTYMAKYVADNPLPEYTKQLYSKQKL